MWFLLDEGLDRAEKWFSIIAGIASLSLTAASVWLASRQHSRSHIGVEPSPPPPPASEFEVDAANARGGQVDDHTTQTNTANQHDRSATGAIGNSIVVGDEAPNDGTGHPGPLQINHASGQGRVYGVQGGKLIIGESATPDER